jgi:L-serine dehydratase
MTTIDEFYKVGPGPSSSHTIGPMRITYDFYQRASKLPADKLAKATALKVHLFGSLSATGKGHGTERAALAGIVGKEPATVDPAFLDSLRDKPDQSFPVKLGSATFNVSLKDIIYDATKGDFKHPNTMIAKLMAGNEVLLEQEYYSVGVLLGWRRFHRVERLHAAEKERSEVSVCNYERASGTRR